ncbi:ribonuclease III [Candidatus Fermentibacteria bacterium]|nr:ribonuclease III [Candidatus Fermentibacteria bacterium]
MRSQQLPGIRRAQRNHSRQPSLRFEGVDRENEVSSEGRLEPPLQELEQRLGYRFCNLGLLRSAVTHSSAAASRGDGYGRLELLGDSVLDLLVGEYLLDELPGADQGRLTMIRSRMVGESFLSRVGRNMDLARYVRTGKSLDLSVEGRAVESITADVFESLVGAVYVDGGLEAARDLVHRTVVRAFQELEDAIPGSGWDSKSRLQQLCQSKVLGLPSYEVVSRSGPAHDPVFSVRVEVEGTILGRGKGKSKKEAQSRAASDALKRIERMEQGGLPAF